VRECQHHFKGLDRARSEALQYSAGDVEIHGFVQVFNQIITILSTPTCLN